MAVSISINITQGAQNTSNNTTSVTASVVAKWTNGSFNRTSKSGWLKIDGTSYSFTSSFNESETASGSKTLFSKTVTVTHAADGRKTVSCSASYTSGVGSGTVTATNAKTLTTIPRASTLTVNNGMLGTDLSLAVTRASTDFTHTITYKCGTASGTVERDVTTSATWSTTNGNTLSLAKQNPNGVQVSVTFTCVTYDGPAKIGESTKTVTMGIPASVVPTVSLVSVTEANSKVPSGFPFVQNHSQLKVYINAAGAYGSSPMQITLTVCGVEYSGTPSDFANGVTTNIVDCSGTERIIMSVVDTRGRRNITTGNVTVSAYSPPQITTLTTDRCNADGTLNEQGEYMLIKYAASITSLGSKNAKSFVLKYRSSSETEYTSKALSTTAYSVNGRQIIAADSGSSYDIRFEATDAFSSMAKNTLLQTASALLHFGASGTGLGIGKVSEEPNLADYGIPARFGAGITAIELKEGTNLDDVLTMGVHYIGDIKKGYTNCPITTGTFDLEVLKGGFEGQIIQRLTSCSKDKSSTLQRAYYQGSWGSWSYTAGSNKILWDSGTVAWGLGSADIIELAEPISMQANGIVLVFSRVVNGVVQNYNYNHCFVSKTFAKIGSAGGSVFVLSSGVPFNVVGSKYVYIKDTYLQGHDDNITMGTAASGITYNNLGFVLRYVLGV